MRLPNCPEFIVTWLACQKLEVITVSTMPMLRARELAYIASDAGTTAAVVWGDLREELEKAQAPELERLIVVGETRPGDLAWAGLMDGQAERLQAVDTSAHDVATEMFHIFVSSFPGRVRPGATGVPVPGYDCRVVDDEGHEVPRGTAGPLAIKGPTGCKYWRKPDRQAEYVRFGGWNVTGDVYVQDDDGYFTYQCRSDDMIVTGGYKIPGREVEHVLDEHPAVAECAVVAAPDETRGYVPKAFVVLKPGREPSEALAKELQEHVKQELAPYKYPRKIEFVAQLPRTETGKIRRAELRQQDTARGNPA